MVDNPAIPSQAESVRASVIDGSFKKLRCEGNSHQSEKPAIQQLGWVSTGKDGLNLFYGVFGRTNRLRSSQKHARSLL